MLDTSSVGFAASLKAPWQHGVLEEVRTGRVKLVFDGGVSSAIYKTSVSGPVSITRLGCAGDEHAYELGGGPEKALLQYCSDHYANWRAEIPDRADLFANGAFGENIVCSKANEHNVCIGDIIRLGEEVVGQITQSRLPCFKLNRRFRFDDMAKRAQSLFRTGWYLKILKEGHIQAGDEMVLLERPNPEWTIARVQTYLYEDLQNVEAMKQLIQIAELGSETKDIFSNRLRKQQLHLRIIRADNNRNWPKYRLVKKTRETARILSLVFEAVEPVESPLACQPGSHVRVQLAGKLTRAYSVVDGNAERFELGVALSDSSRGGSAFVHHTLREGDQLSISRMVSNFPLRQNADRHIFIAGGIGITAFLAAMQECERRGMLYHLYYLVRNSADIPFRRYLEPLKETVTVYDKSVGDACEISRIMEGVSDAAHIYCCGSQRLMNAVAEAAQKAGRCKDNVHFEEFETTTSGDPFTARLEDSHKTVEVGGSETLLDTLRVVGLDIPSSCEVGNCGTCRIPVISGRIEHRGTGLLKDEKTGYMLPCVSRGIGTITLGL